MIQFLIYITTMCPSGIAQPCWCKAEVVEQADRFDIVKSTYGTECDIKGHDWQWEFYGCSFAGDKCPGNAPKCSRCQIERKIRTIEHKHEVTDTEEVWDDDGSKVQRPPNKPMYNFVPADMNLIPL